MARENAFDVFDEAEAGAAAYQASRTETVRRAMADVAGDPATAQHSSTPVSDTDGSESPEGGKTPRRASRKREKAPAASTAGLGRRRPRIGLTLPPELIGQMKRVAERECTSVSALVEEGWRAIAKKHGEKYR